MAPVQGPGLARGVVGRQCRGVVVGLGQAPAVVLVAAARARRGAGVVADHARGPAWIGRVDDIGAAVAGLSATARGPGLCIPGPGPGDSEAHRRGFRLGPTLPTRSRLHLDPLAGGGRDVVGVLFDAYAIGLSHSASDQVLGKQTALGVVRQVRGRPAPEVANAGFCGLSMSPEALVAAQAALDQSGVSFARYQRVLRVLLRPVASGASARAGRWPGAQSRHPRRFCVTLTRYKSMPTSSGKTNGPCSSPFFTSNPVRPDKRSTNP